MSTASTNTSHRKGSNMSRAEIMKQVKKWAANDKLRMERNKNVRQDLLQQKQPEEQEEGEEEEDLGSTLTTRNFVKEKRQGRGKKRLTREEKLEAFERARIAMSPVSEVTKMKQKEKQRQQKQRQQKQQPAQYDQPEHRSTGRKFWIFIMIFSAVAILLSFLFYDEMSNMKDRSYCLIEHVALCFYAL